VARLPVGVIGLGGIARKAYLPVLAARADLDLRLCTRDPAALAELGDQYRVDVRCRSVDELLMTGVEAVFVHAATAAHAQIVRQCIDAGVATFVDKPIADRYDTAASLVELARSRDVSLFVGFNRRYAPAYRALRGVDASLVSLSKSRIDSVDDVRRIVFDDFIHVVDTVRFLAPQAVSPSVNVVWRDGLAQVVMVTLTGANTVAVGILDRAAGAVRERLVMHASDVTYEVRDLADATEYRDDVARAMPRDVWASVGEQRGFSAMCDDFVNAVRGGIVLDAADALATHALCEQVVQAAAGQAR